MRKGPLPREGGAVAQGWSLVVWTLGAGLGTEDSVEGECRWLGRDSGPGWGFVGRGGAMREGRSLIRRDRPGR